MDISIIGLPLELIPEQILFDMLKESSDGKLSRKYRDMLRSGGIELCNDFEESGLAKIVDQGPGKYLELTELETVIRVFEPTRMAPPPPPPPKPPDPPIIG